MSTLSINFHKLAKFVNFIIPISAFGFLLAGIYLSFYFHFLSVFFIFLTVINYCNRSQGAVVRVQGAGIWTNYLKK